MDYLISNQSLSLWGWIFYALLMLTFPWIRRVVCLHLLRGRCSTPDDSTVGLSPFSAGDRAISRSTANQERGTGRAKRISMRTWAVRRGRRERRRITGGGGGPAGENRSGGSRMVSGCDSKLMRMAGRDHLVSGLAESTSIPPPPFF